MKNYNIDFVNGIVTLYPSFLRKASSLGTQEYREMLELRRNHADLEEYDVIMGYRADNSYFSFAEDFLNNAISLNHLNSAMRLGELGSQYVLVSQKGFNAIRFDQAKQVDNAVYFPRFINRDLMSKIGYRNNAVNLPFDPSEIYVLDIIRGGYGG